MVAKIKSGKGLRGALSYNENKVKEGRAMLLDAPGFAKDPKELSFADKLGRLQDLAGRNQRATTNTVHISLNFDVTERLPQDQLRMIAADYMEGIGFGRQPFLLYEHTDAGHPHLHLVTTNIDSAGRRISLHNLGKFQSEETRKAIEEKYSLVKAETKSLKPAVRIKPEPVQYGQTDSKRALSNLVGEVYRAYKFTSLAEFNAILLGFNVLADRGSSASVMFRNSGLRYWLTDAKGGKLGIPIKASQLTGQPTLRLLEKRFLLNQALRQPLRDPLRNRVDQAIRKSTGLNDLQNRLSKAGIDLVTRLNPEGRLYGVTFVDHIQQVAFKGSDLGKSYSAAALMSSLSYGKPSTDRMNVAAPAWISPTISDHLSPDGSSTSLLESLLHTEVPQGAVEEAAYRRRKKKWRRHL